MHSRSLYTLAVFAVLGLAACADALAPLPDPSAVAQLDQGTSASARRSEASTRTYSPTSDPTATPTDAPTTVEPTFLKFASWAPPLTTYDTSFTVVVGTSKTFYVMFKDWAIPFVKVEIPSNAEFFDEAGGSIKKGTTVTVYVTIDRVYATVVFGPHGTGFSKKNPAKLSLNYFFLDLGGRMPSDVAIWYQPDALSAWSSQPTVVDIDMWWLVIPLYHFSNYAVAY
ncbi:MAG: hypothetical protein OEW77_08460 [Gemmatimonadota bacterium]|nr:hypothetical protein [Gemmatimonadota bacterium]